MINPRPVALIILDGWGISSSIDGNAISLAHTPNFDEIRLRYPGTVLNAAGESVGLAAGAPGSAEAGHLNLGAGRVVQTDIARIAAAVRDGKFADNLVLAPALMRAAEKGRSVHLIGLISDAGAHSAPETLFALLRMAKRAGVNDVFVHGILDGRDVPPRTADVYVEALEVKMADIGVGRIATLCGRYFAMDSSENWERTARAYTMLVHAEGERSFDPCTAIRNSFLRGLADEFISPIVIEKDTGVPVATIGDGDLVVFFNHRADTMRQLTRSLAVPEPGGAAMKPKIEAICLTEYDRSFNLPVAFSGESRGGTLGSVLADNGIANYRVAGIDRVPHVTNFFNGGLPASQYELDVTVESTDSASRSSEPEMESFKIADQAIRLLEAEQRGILVVNFSAPAIAAETGSLERTVEAVQFVDTCLGGVVGKVLELGGVSLVTATHGGCEEMLDSSGEPHRFTTPNPVPLHIVDDLHSMSLRTEGALCDVAPTILGILGVEKPSEMTGSDLRV